MSLHPRNISCSLAAVISVLVRRASIKDLDALYLIEFECFSYEAFPKAYLTYLINAPNIFCLVAETDNNIVGFVAGSIELYNKRNIAGHIFTLNVLLRYRRKGIGSKLLTEIEKSYKGSERESVTLKFELTTWRQGTFT